MWRLGTVALLACAATAGAAVWTCDERSEIVTTTLVMVRCRASGTYTTGGDAFRNPNVDLCNSANRFPQSGVASTAASATTGQGYVVALDRATHTVVLLTAGNAPGSGVAFVEVAGGTSIEGATFMALVECK